MSNQVIDIEGATTLEISSASDVSVVGSDEERIYLVGDSAISINREGDTIQIHTESDLNVRLPRRLELRLGHLNGDLRAYDLGSSLRLDHVSDARIENVRGEVAIENASGDVTLRAIDGRAQCENVAGDLRLEGCRGADLGNVAGDLRISAVEGDTTIQAVGGDATIENCADEVRLTNVGGDLVARNLAGGIAAPHVGGDARLQTVFVPGREYVVTCGGSAEVLVAGDPSQASIRFELRSGDREISSALSLQEVYNEPGYLRGRLGDGAATVRVDSGDGLRLGATGPGRGFEGGFEGMMDTIGESIESAIEGALTGMFGGRPDNRFERRMQELSERMAQRAEEAARRAEEFARREGERAARRAERMAQKAGRQAQRQAERGMRWGWGQGGFGGFPWPNPNPSPNPAPWPRPAPPRPPAPPPKPRATDEERLVILQMLAEGKISTEDAARLLDALGG